MTCLVYTIVFIDVILKVDGPNSNPVCKFIGKKTNKVYETMECVRRCCYDCNGKYNIDDYSFKYNKDNKGTVEVCISYRQDGLYNLIFPTKSGYYIVLTKEELSDLIPELFER